MGKTWDRGLDYEKIKARLARLRHRSGRVTSRSSFSVMLIQLQNGSRVSEAVEAFNVFLSTGKREHVVRVRKSRSDNTRRILIPSEIQRGGVPRTADQVIACAQYLGINTHSLRYAFVGYLGSQGVAPQVIAKITGHKSLDMILRYTSQKAADELLDKTIKGG